jgi:membrane protein YqaA with SNARE-associated domain
MELVIKLLTVMGMGAVELWTAIPAGFALQLHPAVIGLTAALGSMMGALVVILLGDHLRGWLLRHYGRRANRKGKPGSLNRILQRYGVVGFALVTPLVTGVPVGAALGLALGIPANRLFLWLSFGIICYATVLTLAGVMGLAAIFRH